MVLYGGLFEFMLIMSEFDLHDYFVGGTEFVSHKLLWKNTKFVFLPFFCKNICSVLILITFQWQPFLIYANQEWIWFSMIVFGIIKFVGHKLLWNKHQIYVSTIFLSKVISSSDFHHNSVAAIFDLCKSRVDLSFMIIFCCHCVCWPYVAMKQHQIYIYIIILSKVMLSSGFHYITVAAIFNLCKSSVNLTLHYNILCFWVS